MMPQKITLFYGHVASNLGDLAINQGQAQMLQTAFPEASLQVVFMDAEKSEFLQSAKSSFGNAGSLFFSYFNANYEKALVYHARPERLLHDCNAEDSDLIVLASSEHLFAYSRPENIKSIFWRTLPVLAAKADNKPCVMLPSTFGPFEDPKSSELISSFLTLVDRFAAREAYSARSLQTRFKLDCGPVLLDPAFFIDPTHLRQTDGSVSDDVGPKVLGLSMRSEGWGVRLSKEQRESLNESFKANSFKNSVAFQFSVALSKQFLENDREARVCLFVQTVADEELADHIVRSLSELGFGERIRLIKPISVQDYHAHLAHVDYVVASRFHAIILSLLLNKPVFGVYFETHGHKMPGLFDLLGIASECVDLSVISADAAVQSALRAIAQKENTWPDVQGRIATYKDQTISWIADYQNKSPDNKAFLSALGAFGDLAFSLARTGFETSKRQSIKILQQQLLGLKTKFGEAEKLSQKTLEKAQSQLKETEGLMKAARKHAQTHQAQAQDFERQLKEARQQAQTRSQELQEARQQALTHSQKLKQEVQEARQQAQTRSQELQEARQQALSQAQKLKQEVQEARQQAQVQIQTLERQVSEVYRQAQAEAKALRSQIVSLEQQEAETKKFHQREYDRAVRKTKDLVKSHLSYRFGKVLVDSANPIRWPAVPYRLYRAWKEYKNDKAVIALITADAQLTDKALAESAVTANAIEDQVDMADRVLKPESISAALENQGVQAAIQLVDNLNRKETPRVRAMALIRAGKALWDRGNEEAEFPFAQTAVEIDRSEPVLRAFFWAAQRAQAYTQSCDTILELEKIYGDKPTPVQQDLLQKLKAAPAYQLSVLKETTPVRISKISSIRDRICYVLHNTLPYSSGGYATRSHGVATGLKKAGWDIAVLSRPGFPLDIKPELTEPDIVATDSIDGIAYNRTLYPKRAGMTARDYMLAAADAIETKLREHRPAIVMAASNHVTGLPALIAARRAGLPFIYEVRGLWEITRMSRETNFKIRPRSMFKKS